MMAAISDNVCLEIIKKKQGQDHDMINFHLPPGKEDVRETVLDKMEVSGGEGRRLSGSGQSSYTRKNEQNKSLSKQNNIDQSKLTRVGPGELDIPSSSTTKCQEPGLQV